MDVDQEFKVTAENVRLLREKTGMGLMEAKRLLALQSNMATVKALQGASLEDKVEYLFSDMASNLQDALSEAEKYLPEDLKLETRLADSDRPEPG